MRMWLQFDLTATVIAGQQGDGGGRPLGAGAFAVWASATAVALLSHCVDCMYWHHDDEAQRTLPSAFKQNHLVCDGGADRTAKRAR